MNQTHDQSQLVNQMKDESHIGFDEHHNINAETPHGKNASK